MTVLAKGTIVGSATDAEGHYALQVPPQATELVFSSVGYNRQELPIRRDGYLVLNAELTENAQALQEAVVVGYGTTRRQDLTGAVQMLQGRVGGVQVQSQPGGAIRIREASSLPASAPLLIVNGLPYAGNLADLTPQDILKTEVLKGEAATGLYGARAAAGVILITTRPGSAPAGLPAELLPGADPRLSLRRRFADAAWWRPTLLTNEQGWASTDVTLPDDLTGWDTFIVGSDAHGRVGGATTRLHSFKALRAALAGRASWWPATGCSC